MASILDIDTSITKEYLKSKGWHKVCPWNENSNWAKCVYKKDDVHGSYKTFSFDPETNILMCISRPMPYPSMEIHSEIEFENFINLYI